MEGIAFPGALRATVNGTVASGQLIDIKRIGQAPLVEWLAMPETLYTLIVIDPNATAKSWLHWLVVNCAGNNPSTGTVAMEWQKPAPPPGTGIHNYYICLFSHPNPVVSRDPDQRGYFDINTYAADNGLTPVSAASIRVQAR